MIKWPRKRSAIGQRLAISFGTLVVLMFLGSAVAVRQFQVMRTESRYLHQMDLRESGILRVHGHVLRFEQVIQRALEAHDAGRLAAESDGMRRAFEADVERALEALGPPASLTDRDAGIRITLETIGSSLTGQAEAIVALARLGDWQGARLRLDRQGRVIAQASEQLVRDVDEAAKVERASRLERIRRTQQHAAITFLATLVATVLLAAALGFAVTRGITGPLSRLDAGAQALAGGDFRHQVAVKGHDELATLGRVFNEMSSRLGDLYEAVQRSEEHFRSLIENASDLVTVVSAEGTILYASPSSQRVTGYPPEALVDRTALGFLHPDDVARAAAVFARCAAGRGVAGTMELRFRHSDGTWRILEATASSVLDKPAVRGIVVNCRDVTEQRQAQQRVESSLREKEVLLKEVHHRVKNNLQIVSSLLNLQSGRLEEQEGRKLLRESQDRVRSMALVHEKLYQSGDLARIAAADYVQSLAINLFQSYGVDRSRIRLTAAVDDVELGIETAIPCGLLINELVSNALQHAFPEGQGGEVHIELRRQQYGQILLQVSDDGVGLPAGLDHGDADSIGLQLVRILTEQLGGTLSVGRDGGTRFEVRFSETRH